MYKKHIVTLKSPKCFHVQTDSTKLLLHRNIKRSSETFFQIMNRLENNFIYKLKPDILYIAHTYTYVCIYT